MNFQKNTLYLVYLVSSCFLCGYFPDLSDFLYPEFPRSTLILSLGGLWLTSRSCEFRQTAICRYSAAHPFLVSSRNAPPHDSKNGCVADYELERLWSFSFLRATRPRLHTGLHRSRQFLLQIPRLLAREQSRKSHASASVSVWFRGKEKTERRGTRSSVLAKNEMIPC